VFALTLRASIRRFVLEGELQPPTPERITRADPEHPLFLESGPPLRVQEQQVGAVPSACERRSANSYCAGSDVKKGSRIIYTPPYESWLQPIEMVWRR